MVLNKAHLVEGLKALGVKTGMILCIHSSLSALGKVEGGAHGLIEALMEVVGSEGTLMMPTHPARDGQTFNPETIPSAMGIVSEMFRKIPGVIRSRHPYHPVAAWGKEAGKLLEDHEKSLIPDGITTPYGRLVRLGGYVLMLGCDLDTMTLLHHVEAVLDLPYLRRVDMTYVDAVGQEIELEMKNVPGGHRGGVLKFENIFKENNMMQVGQIGNAVCRLIYAPDAANLMQRVLSDDPAFVLDDNPYCDDCLNFRGMINSTRLATEQFGLHVRLPYHADINIDRFMRLANSIGATGIEVDYNTGMGVRDVENINKFSKKYQLEVPILRVGPFLQYSWPSILDIAQALNVDTIHCTPPSRLEMSQTELESTLIKRIDKASEQGIKLLVGNQHNSLLSLPSLLTNFLTSDKLISTNLSYNPLEALRSGIKPFYEGIYSGSLRRSTVHIEVCDGIADNPENGSLGQGKCEIREILSNLRSRMYDGILCLWPIPLLETEGVLTAGRQFWQLIDMI